MSALGRTDKTDKSLIISMHQFKDTNNILIIKAFGPRNPHFMVKGQSQ